MEWVDRRVEDFRQMMTIEMSLVNNNNPNPSTTNPNEYDHPSCRWHDPSNSRFHTRKNHLEMVSRSIYLDKLFRKRKKGIFQREECLLLGTFTDTFDCRRSMTFLFNDLKMKDFHGENEEEQQTSFGDDWEFWIDQDNRLIVQNFSKDYFHTTDNYNSHNLI